MDIELEDQPFDLDFHPSVPIVAVALITGRLQLFRYVDISSEPERLWTVTAHTESCRAARFINAGSSVLTASPDWSILATNVETGQPVARLDNAHGAAINRLINLTETTFASGDEDGTIKNGKKVVCGSQEGVLLLYSWGYFKDCSDRFVGHPHSVDALLKLDEDTVLTGSSDGIIRVVSILPNKMIGVIGEHSSYPIECLAFSHDRNVLGSASHDQILKLWDIHYLHEDDEPETNKQEAVNDEDVDMDLDVNTERRPRVAGSKRKKRGEKGQTSSQKKASDFFADI